MNIFFRADANSFIGMGHIMRCLSIADAALLKGHDVVFILSDKSVEAIIKNRGYETIILNSNYLNISDEIALLTSISTLPDILIVDSYYVTSSYLLALRKIVGKNGKIVYLDDIVSFPYPVDLLINYNVYADRAAYEELYSASSVAIPQLILGASFVPLRSMFQCIPKRVQKKEIHDVLISTGGTDELHISLSIVEKLCEYHQGERIFHFLLGAMNTDADKIRNISTSKELKQQVVIHENVTDMRELITSMDVAVSAAGSTLYEISACGVPLITYSTADNQLRGAEAFSNLGLAINLGDLRDPGTINHNEVISGKLSSTSVERIMSAIDNISNDYIRRVEMGEKMQDLIDGYGANKIVEKIIVSI